MTLARKACERPGCTNHLSGRQKRYCSNECRAISEHAKKRMLAESVALEAVREAVEPVVREALTEKALLEIKVLVDLIPEAIEALKTNLGAEIAVGEGLTIPDAGERRQAAALILKYTLGNTSIAPASADVKPPAFNINFGMPQQGDAVADADGSVLEAETIDDVLPDRECVECQEPKPADQFVGNSNRCQACHAKMLDGIRERHPSLLPSGS